MSIILLVEDNELNRDMLRRRLERKGYEVLTANDGEEGIDKAVAFRPDLILMDIGLPEMNGWDVTRSLKAMDATQSIPIIALTAHATSEDRKKSWDAGCDDFDTKPIRIQSLLEKIGRFIEKN